MTESSFSFLSQPTDKAFKSTNVRASAFYIKMLAAMTKDKADVCMPPTRQAMEQTVKWGRGQNIMSRTAISKRDLIKSFTGMIAKCKKLECQQQIITSDVYWSGHHINGLKPQRNTDTAPEYSYRMIVIHLMPFLVAHSIHGNSKVYRFAKFDYSGFEAVVKLAQK